MLWSSSAKAQEKDTRRFSGSTMCAPGVFLPHWHVKSYLSPSNRSKHVCAAGMDRRSPGEVGEPAGSRYLCVLERELGPSHRVHPHGARPGRVFAVRIPWVKDQEADSSFHYLPCCDRVHSVLPTRTQGTACISAASSGRMLKDELHLGHCPQATVCHLFFNQLRDMGNSGSRAAHPSSQLGGPESKHGDAPTWHDHSTCGGMTVQFRESRGRNEAGLG